MMMMMVGREREREVCCLTSSRRRRLRRVSLASFSARGEREREMHFSAGESRLISWITHIGRTFYFSLRELYSPRFIHAARFDKLFHDYDTQRCIQYVVMSSGRDGITKRSDRLCKSTLSVGLTIARACSAYTRIIYTRLEQLRRLWYISIYALF